MSYTNSLLKSMTAATTTSTPTSSKGASSLGQDAFLQLLVTQLQYQDPLSPMDDKTFVAELAQFSSLEQLTEINSGIDNLGTQGTQQQLLGSVNFIGKTIEATGSAASLTNGTASPVTFTLPTDAQTCLVNVVDTSGQVVRTVDIGSTTAGQIEFTWDGKDYDGNVMNDGLYKLAMTATDANGAVMNVTSTMTGKVIGISQENGTYYLNMGNGRNITYTDITNVIDSSSASNQGS